MPTWGRSTKKLRIQKNSYQLSHQHRQDLYERIFQSSEGVGMRENNVKDKAKRGEQWAEGEKKPKN